MTYGSYTNIIDTYIKFGFYMFKFSKEYFALE